MSLSRVFVSYKRGHTLSETLVSKIEKELAGKFEFLRDVNMDVGRRWSYHLYEWLLSCDAAIIIVSKEANAADWCRREWSVLTARWEVARLPLIPICVEAEFFPTGILDEIQSTKGILGSDQISERIKSSFADLPTLSLKPSDYLAAHRAWLRWQFNDAPFFGRDPYSLGDVYIEPECGLLRWEQIRNEKLDCFLETDECGGRHTMLSTVLDLIGDPEFGDVIVIQAGPGAGKSAFTLRLANELIKEQLQPILVRFRDLRLANFSEVGELLDDALRIGFSDEQSPHPKTDIIKEQLEESLQFREATICKTLIILDGWDEVSLTGNESFKAQLATWLPKLRQYLTDRRGPKIRLILTGRPSSEVSHSGVLHRATQVLTMRPMRPEQLEQFAVSIARRLEAVTNDSVNRELLGPIWSLDTGSLEPVITHYRDWFSAGSDDKSSSSGDFLGNPLLAYLAFRVFAETEKSPQELLDQPTALYHELINIAVAHAGKAADDPGLDDSVHRGGQSLRRLLQEVAATNSILRTEAVSHRELNARLTDSELPVPEQLLQNWSTQAHSTTALQELVINFYFKGETPSWAANFCTRVFGNTSSPRPFSTHCWMQRSARVARFDAKPMSIGRILKAINRNTGCLADFAICWHLSG
jgi:hypothetical protein